MSITSCMYNVVAASGGKMGPCQKVTKTGLARGICHPVPRWSLRPPSFAALPKSCHTSIFLHRLSRGCELCSTTTSTTAAPTCCSLPPVRLPAHPYRDRRPPPVPAGWIFEPEGALMQATSALARTRDRFFNGSPPGCATLQAQPYRAHGSRLWKRHVTRANGTETSVAFQYEPHRICLCPYRIVTRCFAG